MPPPPARTPEGTKKAAQRPPLLSGPGSGRHVRRRPEPKAIMLHALPFPLRLIEAILKLPETLFKRSHLFPELGGFVAALHILIE